MMRAYLPACAYATARGHRAAQSKETSEPLPILPRGIGKPMQFRVGFFMLKGKTMPLNKSELALVAAIDDKGFGFAEAVHRACAKAVAKAYTTADDGGEFARAIFAALPVYAMRPVAEWLRKHGLAVSIDGKKGELSRIGGILRPKFQRRDIEEAKRNPPLAMVDAHVPSTKPRAAKEDVRTIKAKAADAVAAFVARQKKADPEVGAAINSMLGKPAWVARLDELNLSAEEVDQIVDAVFAARAQGALKAAA